MESVNFRQITTDGLVQEISNRPAYLLDKKTGRTEFKGLIFTGKGRLQGQSTSSMDEETNQLTKNRFDEDLARRDLAWIRPFDVLKIRTNTKDVYTEYLFAIYIGNGKWLMPEEPISYDFDSEV